MIKVKNIFIYPIKSMPGISLETTFITPNCIQGDRTMMLIDDRNKFVTLREEPQLTNFQLKIENESLIISVDREVIKIDEYAWSKNCEDVKIWNDKVQSITALPEINEWLSDHLKKSVRLVKKHRVDSRSKQTTQGVVNTNYVDSYPLLLLSAETVKHIGTMVNHVLSPLRFRPNIVIQGVEEYGEDDIKTLQSNHLFFNVDKECYRCKIINMSEATGHIDFNLLKTLSLERRRLRGIALGMKMVSSSSGVLSIGEELKVTYK